MIGESNTELQPKTGEREPVSHLSDNPDDDLHQNITEQFWSIIVWFIYRQTCPNMSKQVQTFNLLQRHWLGHLWPLTLRPAACMRVMDVPNRNRYSGPFYVIFTNSQRSCQFWCRFSSLDVKKSRLNMQNSWNWPPTVSTGPVWPDLIAPVFPSAASQELRSIFDGSGSQRRHFASGQRST